MADRHHKPAYIVLILTTVMMFLVTMFFNVMAGQPNLIPGLFLNSTGDVSDRYYLEITPAGWTFSIWGFIYTYQVIFLAYGLSTICRKSERGYLYYSPGHMPSVIYVTYICNLACNVSWLILWDRGYLPIALIMIALVPFLLYVALFFSMRCLHQNAPDLIGQGKATEIRLVIGMVHNALAMYATWVTIAALLNGAMVLIYYLDFKQDIGCTIALCVLAFEVVLYVVMDFVLFEEYLRYLFTPYIVLHVALAGSIAKNWNPEKPNSILTAGLMAIGALLVILKVAHCIYMSRKKPLYRSNLRQDAEKFGMI